MNIDWLKRIDVNRVKMVHCQFIDLSALLHIALEVMEPLIFGRAFWQNESESFNLVMQHHCTKKKQKTTTIFLLSAYK